MFLAPPPPPSALCGPPTPAIKGLAPASTAFSVDRGLRMALREMPGAVVEVEDETPFFRPLLSPSLRLSTLRLFTGGDLPSLPVTPPPPTWMDPSVTVSGGNTVQRLFTVGGGRF